MSANIIDAELFARMFLAGARNLEAKKEWINELNVFPVPDGDTGTNMTMTIMSAAGEVTSMTEYHMDKLAKAMSSGSLRGARGNSGVILSQLLRGFCKVIREHDELNTAIIVAACQRAVETAYKAVMKPKEGTILTVARGGSEAASELLEEQPEVSMEELLAAIVGRAKEVLKQTPEMLPVLKEAGVVDSGGQGLVQILIGAQNAFLGVESSEEEEAGAGASLEEAEKEEEKYTYSADFTVFNPQMDSTAAEEFCTFLTTIGGGMASRTNGETLNVHLLTNDPGAALQKALLAGALLDVKIEHLHEAQLREQMAAVRTSGEPKESTQSNEPPKEAGFVVVSAGEGLSSIFTDLGADVIIEGGQTMNPSTEDVLKAIEKINAATVFVFPNNKNIILAATQAQSMTKDKEVIVIPTKTIPQGIAALINYQPQLSARENEQSMYREIRRVRTGQITYAIRNTHLEEKEIHEGDYMGIGDKEILAVGQDLAATALDTITCMMTEDTELISIYYGEEITEEAATSLADQAREAFPECEIEVAFGGQPVYYYIISAE